MLKKDAKKRIEKLKEVINYHRYLYHVLDRQEIPDAVLDSLKKELFDLEQKFPDLITPDSPTQRVGGEPLDKFEKVKHIKPMLSFNDAFSLKEMEDWQNRIFKLLTKEEAKKIDFFCELKIDGLAIELVYEKGILKTGSTRGNGIIGEDVTQNLKTIEAIPLKLRDKKKAATEMEKIGVNEDVIEKFRKYDFNKPIIVRGEAFIPREDFEAVNRQRKKEGLSAYSNPRNLAAGSIRQLNPKITAKRHLDSFAYELVTDFGAKTHEEKHKILKILGFKINNHNKYCRNLQEVFDFYNQSQKLREKLSYEIDGLVVIVNSNSLFEKLGVVGKAPRGAIAFKFPAKQTTTIVEDIKVQVGRTGALTPVAYLKPVEISGVTVSRATLHNEDEIKRLGLKIGDTVIVGRAGDVIPDIIKVLKELRNGEEKEFKMPKNCPVCGSKIKRKPGEVVSYCPNPNCFAKQREYFYHFVSKSAFDIKGLGLKIIDQLIEEGLVSDPADLYNLKEGDIILLKRFAKKSAANLIKAIQESKKIPLAKFIYALGIRQVGEKTAEDLAEKVRNIENLRKMNLEELMNIKDIGPIAAKSIYQWFNNRENIEYLEKLKKVGIKIENPISVGIASTRQKLSGLKFVLTGSLESMSRLEAEKRIKKLGGKVVSSVSKNTDYLIEGKEPGKKRDRARELGIKIIDEEKFLNLLKK